ncbi:unnamed protein product [Calicophoron daubneyi]|uniref:Uncharacterized protein n=1 Tax=Calicophoron daubneyi TaxID=300641 RepID=A0AAV2T2T4_CALDB
MKTNLETIVRLYVSKGTWTEELMFQYFYLSNKISTVVRRRSLYYIRIRTDHNCSGYTFSAQNRLGFPHEKKKSEITFVEWSSEPVPRSMFYRARYTYHFDPRSSVASDHTGTVTSLNLAYVFFKPFVTGTPHHVYWYNKDWGFSSSTNPAAFNMLNSTETKSDLIEMDTGVKDVNEIGQIRSVNRKSTLRVWENKEANRITGTDGSFARTGLKLGSTQDIYIPEVCRTFRAESIGMQPSKNYPDIETTGMVLEGNKRIQFNILTNKCFKVSLQNEILWK